MLRFFTLLCLAAAAVWLVLTLDLFGRNFQRAAESLQRISKTVLTPLDSPQPVLEEQIRKKLNDVRAVVNAHPSHPNSRRMLQACALLEQALEERLRYLDRAGAASPASLLDTSPRRSRIAIAQRRTENPAALSLRAQSSFFTQAAMRAWRERIFYYQPQVDRLLAP